MELWWAETIKMTNGELFGLFGAGGLFGFLVCFLIMVWAIRKTIKEYDIKKRPTS